MHTTVTQLKGLSYGVQSVSEIFTLQVGAVLLWPHSEPLKCLWRRADGRTDRQTDWVKPIYTPPATPTLLCDGYKNHVIHPPLCIASLLMLTKRLTDAVMFKGRIQWTWSLIQYKDHPSRYRDSHYGDKMVVRPYRWLSARLQYLQCISNGDTAVLH